MSESLSKNLYAWRSVWFHRRLATSIALGVATAATVIVGALLVGDSMRGSLLALTVDRLGRIDQVIIPGTFFDVEHLPSQIDSRDLVPIILFSPGVIETSGTGGEPVRRSSSIQIFGVDPSFKKLDRDGSMPETSIGQDEVVLNRAAANELGVSVGDTVTVRLPSEQAVPADSPLGKRDSQTEGIPRLKVIAIAESRGLARFALHPNQVEPLSAFLARETIASTLDRSGQANALLVSSASGTATEDIDSTNAWTEKLPLTLADFGIKLSRVTRTFEAANESPVTVLDYYHVTSDQLLLPTAAVERLLEDFKGDLAPQPAMTYLANAIERIDRSGNVTALVPYSIVTAIDPSESLPLDYKSGEEAKSQSPDESVPMVISDWTANVLSASVGDRLRISYYEPEVEGGREVERTFDARLTAIVPVTKPSTPYRRNRPNQFDTPPTVYNDPNLTPSVPGVTDQESISDWDLPFKLDRKISPADDQYWADHRLTPKAFIPLAAGQRLFGSRFGDTTSLRFAADAVDRSLASDANAKLAEGVDAIDRLEAKVRDSLFSVRSRLGWAPIEIRDTQLAASRGTTPFDALFLSLSLFVILAAVMLISLLYRLGMLQRGREYGLLLATGWEGKSVSGMAIREGLWSSIPGIILGLFGGVAYAWLVLAGLKSWWVGAVTVPFLEFHATPKSFLIGGLATGAVALLTIWTTAARLRKATAQSLLAGRVEDNTSSSRNSRWRRITGIVAIGLTIAAIGGLIVGALGSGMVQAGAFVGAGMMLLCATLFAIHRQMTAPVTRNVNNGRPYSISKLSIGNLRRNPLRSTLAIGLIAVATFLIVSIGAFQLSPTETGIGGFSLMARTATPLYRDLNDPQIQSELLGKGRENIVGTEIISMRLKAGQDASCNNLYQAEQPQVLSIPPLLAKNKSRVSFDWASHLELKQEGDSAWTLLEEPAVGSEDNPIPMVLDQNTAMWSLKLGLGQDTSFEWTAGKPIYFRVVGMLSNSTLQGSLLVGESNFEKAFPDVSGYQFFLIDTDEPAKTVEVLENRLSDIGMDVVESEQVLARLMAVQNTYLKTFQSLGALGLLLGTFGLAIAQLRSVLERQGELAVMRAIGFAKSRLAYSVMVETAAFLVAGIGTGLACAAIAIAPQAIAGRVMPPFAAPLIAVLTIALVGLVAGLLAVSRVVRLPLIESLRR